MTSRCCLRALWVTAILAAPASSQELAFRRFGIQDGLGDSRVNCSLQDDKGYLWFGTAEGLSRFDGRRFTTYGTRHGLGSPEITGVAIDGRGRLWVATWGGGVSM